MSQKAGEAHGKVTDKMTSQGKKLFAELQKLAELEVKIGFTTDKKGYDQNHSSVSADDLEDGTTIAHVAAWNEFGTEHIPERPFMRQSVDKHGDTLLKAAEQFMGQLAQGKLSADDVMRKVGALQVGFIQHEIDTGNFAELADATKKRKDSTKPLIDTGHMRQSVHYVVKPRKG